VPSPPLVPLSIGKYAIVRFLGTDTDVAFAGASSMGGVERYIARAEAAGESAPRLILERVTRESASAADFDAFTRRARRIAMLRHPNVPRVRDVFTTAEHAVVVSEYLEGKRWGSLDAHAQSHGRKPLSLEARLKVLLDALSALSVIHPLREPGWSSASAGAKVPSMIHGGVAPSNVLVGTDGVTRLLRIHRTPLRAPSGPLDGRSAHSAPEILLGDGTADGRADLYSVGVILWEILSGKPLFTEPTVANMLSRQLAGDLPAASAPPSAPWAAPLVQVAATALAVDPKRRYASAIDLGLALRSALRHRLPGTAAVAREVREILGIAAAERPPTPVPRAKTAHGIGPVSVPLDVPPTPPPPPSHLAAKPRPTPPPAAPSDLAALDERWSKVSVVPSALPAGPPPPAPAPAPPNASAATPLVFTAPPPGPLPEIPPSAPWSATPAAPLRMTPAPPVPAPLPVTVPRPSDITALKLRPEQRRRRALLLLAVVALFLLISVGSLIVFLRAPGASPATDPLAASTKAGASSTSLALANAPAFSSNAGPSNAGPSSAGAARAGSGRADEPARPSPPPPPANAAATHAVQAPVRPSVAAATSGPAPHAKPPAVPRSPPSKATPPPKAGKLPPPPPPKTARPPHSRSTHDAYVPLGI